MTFILCVDDAPREHDYTSYRWGHALHGPRLVSKTDPTPPLWNVWGRLYGPRTTTQVLVTAGHGSVRVGDTMLVKMASGQTARFLVIWIEYEYDPRDMFTLRATFVEYLP